MTWEQQRTSFGAGAAGYDARRPGWPAATAAWLTGSPAGRVRVVDVGAGTGKLTRALVEAGHDVVAVEPDAGMLEVLSAALPSVAVHRASAEALPLPDASADAVTAAQAWHWFDGPAAAAECARVLRPGGVLGIGWHVRDVSVPWVAELERLVGAAPAEGARTAASDLRDAPFGPVETAGFGYELALDPAGLAELAGSWSYVAVRDDRDAVLADVRRLGERVAAPSGALVLPYRTHCFRAVRA